MCTIRNLPNFYWLYISSSFVVFEYSLSATCQEDIYRLCSLCPGRDTYNCHTQSIIAITAFIHVLMSIIVGHNTFGCLLARAIKFSELCQFCNSRDATIIQCVEVEAVVVIVVVHQRHQVPRFFATTACHRARLIPNPSYINWLWIVVIQYHNIIRVHRTGTECAPGRNIWESISYVPFNTTHE